MELNKDFKEFLDLLNKHQVDYMVVGGFALAFHGAPRYTGDIDIWIPFIGREAYLKNKRASGRPKDLADIDALGAL